MNKKQEQKLSINKTTVKDIKVKTTIKAGVGCEASGSGGNIGT